MKRKKNGKWKITNWMNSPLEKEQERKKGKNLPFKSFVNWDRVDMIARRFVYCEWDDDDVNVDCNSFSTQFFYFSHTHAHAHTPIHGIRFATFILCILLFSVYFFSLSFFFASSKQHKHSVVLVCFKRNSLFKISILNLKDVVFCVFGHGAFRFTLLIYGANSYYSMATALSVASTKWDSWIWSSIKAANDDTSLVGSDLAKFSFFLLFTSDEWLFSFAIEWLFPMRFVTFGNFIYLILFIHWNCNNSSNRTQYFHSFLFYCRLVFIQILCHFISNSMRFRLVDFRLEWKQIRFYLEFESDILFVVVFFSTNFFLITR